MLLLKRVAFLLGMTGRSAWTDSPAPVNHIKKLIWVYSPTADDNLNFSKMNATALFEAARLKGLTVQFLNADKILPGQPLEQRQAALKATLKRLTEAENSFVLIRTHGNIDNLPKTGKTDTKLSFFTYRGHDILYSEIAQVLDPQAKVLGVAIDACHADNAYLNESGKKVPGRVTCATSVNEYGQGPEASQWVLDTLTGLMRQTRPVPLGKTATNIHTGVLRTYNKKFSTQNAPLTSYGEDRLAYFGDKAPGHGIWEDAEGRPVSLCVSPLGKKLFAPGMKFGADELDPDVNGYEQLSRRETLSSFRGSSFYFVCQENGQWRVEIAPGAKPPVRAIPWKMCTLVIENLKIYNRTAAKPVVFDEAGLKKQCVSLANSQAWLESVGWRLPAGYQKALPVELPGSCVDDMGHMVSPDGTVDTELCCVEVQAGGSGVWDAVRKQCRYTCSETSGRVVREGACFTPRSVAGRELSVPVQKSFRCQSGEWPWNPDKACCEQQGGKFEVGFAGTNICVAPSTGSSVPNSASVPEH